MNNVIHCRLEYYDESVIELSHEDQAPDTWELPGGVAVMSWEHYEGLLRDYARLRVIELEEHRKKHPEEYGE